MNKTPPVKLAIFDLDGTTYLSGKLLPGARRALQQLTTQGIDYAFMTNNSSVAPPDYLRKLRRLGLTASPRNILTSAEATLLMLAELGLGPRLFVLGTIRFRNYLARNGYTHTAKNPAAVLVAFDTELDYTRLTTATRLLERGLPLVASHPDTCCPTTAGPMPDAGVILAALKAATGAKPTAIAGKPHRWIVQLARRNFAVKAPQIAIIGDRLQTDIKMAKQHRMRSVLTLTGVTSRRDLAASRTKPDAVINSIADLAQPRCLKRLKWI